MKDTARTTAAIYACWLAWIVPSLPCLLDWDTVTQLFQYATPAPCDYYRILLAESDVATKFVDHKPLATTLLYGSVWELGVAIGSQQAAFGTFSVLQSALAAFEMGASVRYAEKIGLPRPAANALAAFIALFPPFPRFACAMVSDALFALAFVPYLAMTIEICRTKGGACREKRFLLAYAVCAVLCMLTKKLGAFIVVPSGLVLALSLREEFARIVAATAIPAALALGAFPAVAYPALDCSPGGVQETLGPFLQQTATVLANHRDEMSVEEVESVEAVFATERIDERLDERLTDGVKKWWNPDTTPGQLAAFARTYLALGLEYPQDYASTLFKACEALIVPSEAIELPWSSLDFTVPELVAIEGPADIDLRRPEALVRASAAMDEAYAAMADSPLWPAFAKATYATVVPLSCCALLFFKRAKRGGLHPTCAAPVLVSWLFLFVSPASAARYMLPLLFSLPLLAGMAGSRRSALSPKAGDESAESEVAVALGVLDGGADGRLHDEEHGAQEDGQDHEVPKHHEDLGKAHSQHMHGRLPSLPRPGLRFRNGTGPNPFGR